MFARYTQVAFLRLLTNQAVMDEQTLTGPLSMDAAFREATAPLAAKAASKWVGDCYLLAYAKESQAALVTFDRPLVQFARKRGHAAIVPG